MKKNNVTDTDTPTYRGTSLNLPKGVPHNPDKRVQHVIHQGPQHGRGEQAVQDTGRLKSNDMSKPEVRDMNDKKNAHWADGESYDEFYGK
jgi:hypothetical protein